MCEWGLKLSFREENALQISKDHPSMRTSSKRGPRRYEILNVTSEVIRDYDVSSPPPDRGLASSAILDDASEPEGGQEVSGIGSGGHSQVGHASMNLASIDFTPSALPFTDVVSPSVSTHSAPVTRRQTDSAVANLLYFSQGGQLQAQVPSQQPASVAANMSLGFITDYLDPSAQAFASDINIIEDGIFLPGTAYHELHSTLRQHLIQEVRSNATTRPSTPHPDGDDASSSDGIGCDKLLSSMNNASTADSDRPILSEDEECGLWRNYFDEVAPWLDKFDNDRVFQFTLPTLAHHNEHLRYSILALSARQKELKAKEISPATGRSFALYQEAIHMLLPTLASRSTAVIASCVILCVLEMVSCSPKAWQRHLDGCASLMEAVGINGFVGGVDQALFWVFARMDVCGGLISSVPTLIPVAHWASKSDLESDVRLFKSIDAFAGWANYAIYLAAQVLNLLAPLSDVSPLQVKDRGDAKYRARWLALWKHICAWIDGRPPELLPIMTLSSSDESPFPTIIFSNPAAISGNQMFHTASVLMLQNQPYDLRLPTKPRSILWHARRICGISISNDHHGAWTNALQPLWVAGRCMSHPAEHRAIVTVLEKIERESGWSTKWRQDDLEAYWGDLGD